MALPKSKYTKGTSKAGKHKKKTTIGCGRGTKMSHTHSKRYIKKYRGQGGRKR